MSPRAQRKLPSVVVSDRGPTATELQAIEAEWPVIAAELAVLDAEVSALQTGVESSELDRRRLRRVQGRLTRQIVADARWGGSLDGAA